MALNIKNVRTVELVRRLAARTGRSRTSAIEHAVAAELERLDAEQGSGDRDRRLAAARDVLAELDATLSDADRAALSDAERDLYDASGLPR